MREIGAIVGEARRLGDCGRDGGRFKGRLGAGEDDLYEDISS
jgi:hypothetical protein